MAGQARKIYECKRIGSGTYADPFRPAIGDLCDDAGKPILTYSVIQNKGATMTVVAEGDHGKAQACLSGVLGTKPSAVTARDVVYKADA